LSPLCAGGATPKVGTRYDCLSACSSPFADIDYRLFRFAGDFSPRRRGIRLRIRRLKTSCCMECVRWSSYLRRILLIRYSFCKHGAFGSYSRVNLRTVHLNCRMTGCSDCAADFGLWEVLDRAGPVQRGTCLTGRIPISAITDCRPVVKGISRAGNAASLPNSVLSPPAPKPPTLHADYTNVTAYDWEARRLQGYPAHYEPLGRP
jgi:hypothetical protein